MPTPSRRPCLLHLTLKSTVFLKLLEPLSPDLRCGVTFLTGSSCSQPLQVKVNSPRCGRPSLIRFILPVVVAVVGICAVLLVLSCRTHEHTSTRTEYTNCVALRNRMHMVDRFPVPHTDTHTHTHTNTHARAPHHALGGVVGGQGVGLAQPLTTGGGAGGERGCSGRECVCVCVWEGGG